MHSFSPEAYSQMCSRLDRVIVGSQHGRGQEFLDSLRDFILSDCEKLKRETGRWSGGVIAGAQRLAIALKSETAEFDLALHDLQYLRQALTDDVQMTWFLRLDSVDANLAFEPNQFGAQVDEAFPSASWDIEEASRCLAFDRGTACVFHLARIAELAAITVGKDLGYDSPRPGFGEVLRFLDSELERTRKDYQGANPTIKGNVDFYAATTAQMHAVNQAWRQRVAHLDRKYSIEEAERIYATTKTLMQHLAERLSAPEESRE